MVTNIRFELSWAVCLSVFLCGCSGLSSRPEASSHDAFGDVGGDVAGSRYAILDDARAGFAVLMTGGQEWGPGTYATSMAFGDVDGDGRDEVGIARRHKRGSMRFVVLDDAMAGFTVLMTGGEEWGVGTYATSIAFGDVDGDGRDELGVARYHVRGEMRYQVCDDAAADFEVLTTGGQGWRRGSYASSLTFGDVDGDGRDECRVTRRHRRGDIQHVVLDDAGAGFAPLRTGHEVWEPQTLDAVGVVGDVDGDGRHEFGVISRRPRGN